MCEYVTCSQWPRGLRRGSVAVRLLGLRVRIPPATWMSRGSVVCCQAEVSASGWSPVQRSPTECSVSECDCEILVMRRPWLTRGCRAMGEKNITWSEKGYMMLSLWVEKFVIWRVSDDGLISRNMLPVLSCVICCVCLTLRKIYLKFKT
jgi:hypothetical protein